MVVGYFYNKIMYNYFKSMGMDQEIFSILV